MCCIIVFKGQWCTRESACAPFQNLITEITNQENVDVRSSRITTSSKDHFTKNAEHVKLNFVDRYKKGLEFKLDLL
jgi:hypothetical protein